MKLQVQLENGDMRETIAKSSDSMASVPLRFPPTLARPRLAGRRPGCHADSSPTFFWAAGGVRHARRSPLCPGTHRQRLGHALAPALPPLCPKRPPSTVHCRNADSPLGACPLRVV